MLTEIKSIAKWIFAHVKSVARNNFTTLFLHSHWEMIENKPSACWERADSVPGCVSNMEEQRYAASVRDTTERERKKKKRRQCRSGRENSDTDRERQRHGGQRSVAWGSVEALLCGFGCLGLSLSRSDFDEAVPALISKPNSPRTQWLWFELSLFTLTHPAHSPLYFWATEGLISSCHFCELSLWKKTLLYQAVLTSVLSNSS